MAKVKRKVVSDRKSFGTIGALERAAGIGQSHEERFAFWRQFIHLEDGAFAAGRDELDRMVAAKESYQ